jgi:hypothetical protein
MFRDATWIQYLNTLPVLEHLRQTCRMTFGGPLSQVCYLGSFKDVILGAWLIEQREVIQTWPGQYPFQDQGDKGPQAL